MQQHLEQLVTRLQHLEDKRKEEGVRKPDREDKKGERGVQGSESCRGEGEGRVRMMEERERRVEIIRTQRESGVGEEVFRVQGGKGEQCDVEMEPKRRGEAEGGQKERGKREKEHTAATTSSETQKHQKSVDDNTVTIPAHQAELGPDVELLTKQLQEAQEETDRQATVAQDLRSKLTEQSRKTWEAEQRLVVLEAELQRLKKAAESLGEARRQIEVRVEMEGVKKVEWKSD